MPVTLVLKYPGVTGGPKTMTVQEAADELGVHYMTAYRYIRQGRLPATREGAGWRILTSDLHALRDLSAKQARRGTARSTADCEGLERRMLAGDGSGAWWLVKSQLEGGLDPSGALSELVVPALRSIGERWASGDVSVADEHRATAVAQRLVGHLGLQFGRRGNSRGAIALAAPAGDLHTLPVAIVADLLRWRAFEVLELGGNTPADALAAAVSHQDRLLAVGIVSTTPGLEAEVAESVRSVRAAVPDVTVFLGGPGIRSEGHALELGGDVWTGPEPDAAVETVESIAGSIREQAHSSVG
jgi:MerR family transcriptional regulator, light-induced transcriptional regulator